MSTPAIPLPEFDQEMDATRRLIARVPTEQGAWKPHEKSFCLGHLTQLVARMPDWIANALRESSRSLAGGPNYTLETTETLLGVFDENVRQARIALAEVTGAALDEPWSLIANGRTVFALPRQVVVRQHLRHLVHHRGQLSVYLRLLNVPLPSIYGPTADEAWSG